MVQAVIEKQADAGGEREAVLSVRDLTVGFGDHVVLDNLNLEVLRVKFSASSAPPVPASPY